MHYIALAGLLVVGSVFVVVIAMVMVVPIIMKQVDGSDEPGSAVSAAVVLHCFVPSSTGITVITFLLFWSMALLESNSEFLGP